MAYILKVKIKILIKFVLPCDEPSPPSREKGKPTQKGTGAPESAPAVRRAAARPSAAAVVRRRSFGGWKTLNFSSKLKRRKVTGRRRPAPPAAPAPPAPAEAVGSQIATQKDDDRSPSSKMTRNRVPSVAPRSRRGPRALRHAPRDKLHEICVRGSCGWGTPRARRARAPPRAAADRLMPGLGAGT
ncbi:hypothetical protein EVAR_51517_1 [Eumeta japonica]|uniref:Uncharacterized protein n=1 Tax=Eumeta variegata TaxID=151549 RepID=A0A4C1XET6_EUMVA|nr:hypothetical protein EVAR_51517_1 [Eumeta japonica]